jgi:hypothetical protein
MTIAIILILLISIIFIVHNLRTFKNVEKYNTAEIFLSEILHKIKISSDSYEVLINNKGRVKIKFLKFNLESTLDFIYNPKSIQITLRTDYPFKDVVVKSLDYNKNEINDYISYLGLYNI